MWSYDSTTLTSDRHDCNISRIYIENSQKACNSHHSGQTDSWDYHTCFYRPLPLLGASLNENYPLLGASLNENYPLPLLFPRQTPALVVVR